MRKQAWIEVILQNVWPVRNIEVMKRQRENEKVSGIEKETKKIWKVNGMWDPELDPHSKNIYLDNWQHLKYYCIHVNFIIFLIIMFT